MLIATPPESLKFDFELADSEFSPDRDEWEDADLRLRPALRLDDLQHWIDLNA